MEVRDMILSESEEDYELALNILDNQGMSPKEIYLLVSEITRNSPYMILEIEGKGLCRSHKWHWTLDGSKLIY